MPKNEAAFNDHAKVILFRKQEAPIFKVKVISVKPIPTLIVLHNNIWLAVRWRPLKPRPVPHEQK
jgi:hypothetical protein